MLVVVLVMSSSWSVLIVDGVEEVIFSVSSSIVEISHLNMAALCA